MPQLAATLRNTVTTGKTLVSKEAEAERVPQGHDGLLRHRQAFLNANGDNIIRLGQLSEPILALLARYSSTFPCMLDGIVRQAPRLADTFRGFIFHINLKTIPNQPRAYTAADRPVYGADNAPNCAGLPNPPVPYYPKAGQFPNLNDGTNDLGKGDNQRTTTGFGVRPSAHLTSGTSGTPSQKALINSLDGPLPRHPGRPDVRRLVDAVRPQPRRHGGERGMNHPTKLLALARGPR